MIVNLICRRQYDLKSFVAYSSIVHMSLIVIRVWVGRYLVVVGTVLMRFAHGLCSSALFLKFNNFYMVSGTRNVYLNRGYIYVYSFYCLFWFVFCVVNCSAPLRLTFFSEVMLIFSGLMYNFGSFVVFVFNIFFCGLYCIVLYLLVRHGKSRVGVKYKVRPPNRFVNMLILWYHFFIVYFYFVFFDVFGGLM